MYECRKVDLEFLGTAPICIRADVVIAATPGQIFATFADAESWPRWVRQIRQVQWTSPAPFRAGTTRTAVMTDGLVIDEEFLRWDEGSRMTFAFRATSRKVFDALVEDYRVRDRGDGSCLITWDFHMQPRRALTWLFRLIRPVMTLNNRKAMQRLRKYVESNPCVDDSHSQSGTPKRSVRNDS